MPFSPPDNFYSSSPRSTNPNISLRVHHPPPNSRPPMATPAPRHHTQHQKPSTHHQKPSTQKPSSTHHQKPEHTHRREALKETTATTESILRRRIEQLEKENACVKTEIKRYQDDKKYLSAENKRVQTENKRLVAEISKLEKERELGVPICRLSALNRGEDVWFGSFGPYY